jgi:hypothetical protein
LAHESGIVAVTIAGVVVGNLARSASRALGEFEEQITIGLIGLLFVLLAADVRLAEVASLGLPGLATVAVLALVVRPLDVAVSTLGSELDLRERAFLAWVAPRGVVAAAVATLFGTVLEAQGMAGAAEFRALVFLTIAVTVLVQGGSAPLVARLLGVRLPGRDVVFVLGANELGLALGALLREGGRAVTFLDSNPVHTRSAEERGFGVVFGNALLHSTLARARLERAAAVVGLTPNDEANSLFAREAAEEFDVPLSYVAIGRRERAIDPRILERQRSRALFGGPTDVERWCTRLRHGTARTVRAKVRGGALDRAEAAATDQVLLLASRRGGAWVPFHAATELAPGDELAWLASGGETGAPAAALAGLELEVEAPPPA